MIGNRNMDYNIASSKTMSYSHSKVILFKKKLKVEKPWAEIKRV